MTLMLVCTSSGAVNAAPQAFVVFQQRLVGLAYALINRARLYRLLMETGVALPVARGSCDGLSLFAAAFQQGDQALAVDRLGGKSTYQLAQRPLGPDPACRFANKSLPGSPGIPVTAVNGQNVPEELFCLRKFAPGRGVMPRLDQFWAVWKWEASAILLAWRPQ